MAIFSLGSLMCALAPTFASWIGGPAISWLIGARAFQAIGAASLNPVSLAIIMAVFPYERRGAAIGIWGALSGVAAAAGPVLGGFLVQSFDWRWIFFVNLPFCLIGLVMVALFVPETREKRISRRIDVPGVITLSVAMFCLSLAIIQGNDWGWSSTAIISLFGGALVSLILFIIVEIRVKEPIVDFSLFKIGSFTSSSVATFRQLGFVLGVAILISLFVGQIQSNMQQASNNAIQVVQKDTTIPAQFHPLISNGLKQANTNVNSSNLQTKSVNLAQYANNAPPQFRAQARASLQALSDKITALFKQAVVQSFETTWLAAAFGAVVGFILAFVTLVFRRKGLNEQQSGETVEADVARIG